MRISDVIELCLEPRPASAEVVLKPFGIQSNDGLLGTVAFTQIDTVTIAGNVVSDFTHTPANGTYTVNSDCTGTFTINFTDGRPTVIVNFVVVGGGAEIDTVVTSAGGAQGILATSSIGKRRLPPPYFLAK
jgi:hypothetical protein